MQRRTCERDAIKKNLRDSLPAPTSQGYRIYVGLFTATQTFEQWAGYCLKDWALQIMNLFIRMGVRPSPRGHVSWASEVNGTLRESISQVGKLIFELLLER